MCIYPFGLSAHIKDFEYKKSKDEILITLAGLSVHIIVYFVLPFFVTLNWLSESFMNYLNTININILGFNILPIYPLDGGRIVRNLIEFICPIKLAKKISLLISFMTLIVLLIMGFYRYFAGLFFVCFFVFQLSLECLLFESQIHAFYLFRYLHGIQAKNKCHKHQDLYKNRKNFIISEGLMQSEQSFLAKYF